MAILLAQHKKNVMPENVETIGNVNVKSNNFAGIKKITDEKYVIVNGYGQMSLMVILIHISTL